MDRLAPVAPIGTLHVGTSGFAYPNWAPLFYPAGIRSADLLGSYATRLPACELNNSYYRQPTRERISSWVAATPESFRFTVKAQRGGSIRALVDDPAGTLPWLTGSLDAFGVRLGAVLYRVPREIERSDAQLARLLAAWPSTLPLAVEFQHASWHVDEVLDLLRSRSVAICATELDTDPEPPTIRLTGQFLYLRLRRTAYAPAELEAWAARVVPFLEAGTDVFAFFRHDERGESAVRAMELARLVTARLG